jgi:hypothetical protein
LSAAEYSYGKLHGLQTWYKADGISIDYVEKYWNGARARTDVDHVTGGSGSPVGCSARGSKWTELEREHVKVKLHTLIVYNHYIGVCSLTRLHPIATLPRTSCL